MCILKKNKQFSILKAEQTALRIQHFQLILTVLSFYLLHAQRILKISYKIHMAVAMDISTEAD